MKRSLTPLYCLHQAAFYVSITGINAFALAYLMDKGFSAAQVGIILAASSILSFTLQPLLGSYVDKRSPALLPKMIIGFLSLSFVLLSCVELLRPPLAVMRVLYIIGLLSYSITLTLSNSLCAHYSQNNYRIDYAMGSGMGTLSFSFASLLIGSVIARLGARVMMLLALLFIALQIALVLCYPKIDYGARSSAAASSSSLSIMGFFLRYRVFTLTLLGVVCLAACHAMAENFLLQLFERLGGNSENVGITLFLACITAAPFTIFFEKVQLRVSILTLMRLSGFFYIAKALLLIWAPSIPSIYLIGLLQTCTYAFLFPSLYYFARERIAAQDMVKGQTIASSTFSLGVALGNSVGGAMIDAVGLNAMLALAAGAAVAGTLLVNATILRRDTAA